MLKRKLGGGFLATVGFILSPLSWWNDLAVNIPIAYGIGYLFGRISESLFFGAMLIGYFLTNILGLILFRQGILIALSKKDKESTDMKKVIMKDLVLSVVYTLIMAILMKIGVIKLPWEYFK